MSTLAETYRSNAPKHFPECSICVIKSPCVYPNCRCAICDDCQPPQRMNYVCNVRPGDEEGRGSEDLYQCSKCKAVKAV